MKGSRPSPPLWGALKGGPYAAGFRVEALFARVRQEHGRLDLLVNNVWGGYEQIDWSRFAAPFWEQSLRHWSGMFESGVRVHLAATRLAVPLMLPHRRGLIIHTTAWDRDKYLGNLFYDVAKAAVNRMAFGMARDLQPHHVAVVALAPGFVGTERVLVGSCRRSRSKPNEAMAADRRHHSGFSWHSAVAGGRGGRVHS